MPRSFTSKPCPGCGTMGHLAPNTVCRVCADALRDHRRLVAAAAGAESGQLYSLTCGISPRAAYTKAGQKPFELAFADLLSELCPAAPDGPLGRARPLDTGYDGWFRGDPLDKTRTILVAGQNIHAHVSRVFHAIDALIRQGKAEGVIEGQNLLGQLSSGALSTLDINRMTLDAEKVIRGIR